MKKLFYPVIIAMMLMSQGCFVRDLAGKLNLSLLWRKPEPKAVAVDEIPLDQIHWHEGAEIADWPITHKLTVSVGQRLSLAQGGTKAWRPILNGVVANAWFFVKLNGHWHGGTYEWIRPNVQVLPKREVDRRKLKSLQSILPADWTPKAGEVYGFAMSGLVRDHRRNVQERTNIVLAEWR